MTKDVSSIRNIAFVGHPSSGKTTLVDALAHKLGASDRKGSVTDKTSLMDTEPEEQEKQHTLQAAVCSIDAEDRSWSLIDTPGYPDFASEFVSSAFASDLVVGVVSCTSGVTFNLRSKLAQAAAMGRGRMIAVTHVDAENADFDGLIESLRSSIGEVCVPVRIPNETGSGFASLTRVVNDESSAWRQRLMDRVMDSCEDEELLNEYLETQTLTEDQLEAMIPKAIAAGSVVPVLPLNPDSGVGVPELLTFLRNYAPCPATHPTIEVDDEVPAPTSDGPLCATVFSVKADAHVGKICMARIVRGTLKDHDVIVGPHTDGKGEKIGGLFRSVGGKRRDAIDEARAGEIIAFSKVEGLHVGDTFTLSGQELPKAEFARMPVPMVALAVRPKSRADEQKIGSALHKLIDEDPTLSLVNDERTHELVLHGMSDLHLSILEARLKRRYGVEIETSLPKIAYKETITKSVEAHYRHKKQSGGRGQFGECYIRLRPGEKGSGIQFLDKVVGGSIPRNLIPAVEKGIREVAEKGVLTSSKVEDVEVELYDGKFHAVDSDEASFRTAGARAFREGVQAAGAVLLEPIMEVEIHIPSADAGTIFSDITSHRRGHVIDQSSEGDGAVTIVKAQVPLATMQTYHRDLKSQTAGEGTYSMTMGDYAAVPKAEQAKVLAAQGAQEEDD